MFWLGCTMICISSLCEERDLSDLSTENGGARDIQFDIADRYQM